LRLSAWRHFIWTPPPVPRPDADREDMAARRNEEGRMQKLTPWPRVPRECQGQNEVSEQMAVRAAGEVRAREKLKLGKQKAETGRTSAETLKRWNPES